VNGSILGGGEDPAQGAKVMGGNAVRLLKLN